MKLLLPLTPMNFCGEFVKLNLIPICTYWKIKQVQWNKINHNSDFCLALYNKFEWNCILIGKLMATSVFSTAVTTGCIHPIWFIGWLFLFCMSFIKLNIFCLFVYITFLLLKRVPLFFILFNFLILLPLKWIQCVNWSRLLACRNLSNNVLRFIRISRTRCRWRQFWNIGKFMGFRF